MTSDENGFISTICTACAALSVFPQFLRLDISSASIVIMSVNDRVFELCKSTETISSLLAKDPKLAPGKAAQTLFPGDGKPESTGPVKTPPVASQEELHRAFEAGKWGKTRPSDMFLTVCTSIEQGIAKNKLLTWDMSTSDLSGRLVYFE